MKLLAQTPSRRCLAVPRVMLLMCAALVMLASCSDPEPSAQAREVIFRSELLGGPRALGDVGDIVMENGKVRVIIQAAGFSRGFGVYGGSLIDAARLPARDTGDIGALPVQDAFGELFPAFLLQAVAVDEVEIISAGGPGEAAIVEARGGVGDFLEIGGLINRLAIGSNEIAGQPFSPERIRYTIRYVLEPGASHVRITFGVQNISDEALPLPATDAVELLTVLGLDLSTFNLPIGDVSLFGKNLDVFMPGIGFDVRFGLEDATAEPVDFPGFPGIVTPFIAARDGNASYGLIAAPSERNFLMNARDSYGARSSQINDTSMLVPFVASGFLGIFYDSAPSVLEPGASIETTKYFVIGDGDVGTVLDEILEIRGAPYGRLGGVVRQVTTGDGAEGVDVFVYTRAADGERSPYSQYTTFSGGAFRGHLPAGAYSARAVAPGRSLGGWADFDVVDNERASIELSVPNASRVVVNVRSSSGAPLPAKVTIVGTYDAERVGQEPRTFLFDLQVGESFLTTDFIPDSADDPGTRRYIEAFGFTENGTLTLEARPGVYDVYVSRGPEYDIVSSTVTLEEAGTASVAAMLERVVDTEGWISADVHLHSINSIDSGLSLERRVLQMAAEGVEWGMATDHNYVTDYEPVIAALGLVDWVRSSPGLELTTLESGHFNGYPLDYQVGPITHGAFEWSQRPPAELFAELRSLGRYSPEETIVQVNHPRDSITGYFNQYDRDGITAEYFDEPDGLDLIIEAVTEGGRIGEFSRAFFELEDDGTIRRDADGNLVSAYTSDFDAIEILNGKQFWTIHHFRDEDGSIVLDEDGGVLFPGGVDDWYNLLNLGNRYIGVASSDSHGASDEVGYFRTMVMVGEDDVRAVDERSFFRAMRAGRVIGTNGPMLDFELVAGGTTARLGDDLLVPSGSVTLRGTLSAAPWVSVERINIVRNGVLAESIRIDPGTDLTTPFTFERELALAQDDSGTPIDSWFLVEAIGYDDMFPVVRASELPPVDLTNAISSIAGPLGIDLGGEGGGPSFVFAITPYAITNPIWVNTDEGEWTAPGVVPFEIRNLAENDPGFDPDPIAKNFVAGEHVTSRSLRYVDAVRVERMQPESLLEQPPVGELDIRRLIRTFGHH
ncbi:MAG: hypothetical protein ACJA1R_001932 [Flavobacteriales bacterium]|jgi:hypothetical protein